MTDKVLIERITQTDLTYKRYWLNQLAKLQPESKKYSAFIETIQRHLDNAQVRDQAIETLKINYPEELPVSREVANIKELITNNQVIIICGETGSGKTTQLPKILLEMGYAKRGVIGHTQPRRIAARSLAARINHELGCRDENASLVGSKMRFHDRTNSVTAIKLMTDGILLQEIQHDKLLLQYSAIIIDEVHERSLNIDFILGYLQQLVHRRPDLKIIITSATIENDKLAKFFATDAVFNVSGKTYPVDIIYQPFENEDDDDASLNNSIYRAIVAALEVERGSGLIFLPGEREIKHCLQFLRKTELKAYELLPLYARQNNEEQAQIFSTNGKLKIILATNIAETSLTIPGIKFVIDPGLARVKRYSIRNRVEQLQVENISQASSKQRAGRAGRISHGLCVRLFSEQEFNQRKPFTEPELLRSNLANVILKLLSLNLGDPTTFPFLDAPENKAFNDGFRTLYQIGAIDKQNQITSIGRKLANIPVDVQLARILIAAGEKFATLKEALIVVSFLAIQDPRDFPVEHQQLIRERHSIWADKKSEFNQVLNLWQWFHDELTHKKSNKKLQEICHKHFLSLLRMREWLELHRQLKESLLALGYRENTTPASYQSLHQAILSGFIVNIGQKDLVENYYLSTNGRKFYLHPSLNVTASKWLVTASLVETSRLYARHCAEIEPEWLNGIANHLYKYVYDSEAWDKRRGEVVANKTALLYGLAIYSERISFARVEPDKARSIMIRDGLVANSLKPNYQFINHNINVIRTLEKLEDKLRTSLVMIEDELFEFYARQLPHDVYDIVTLDKFVSSHEKQLFINQDEFIAKLVASDEHHDLYPDTIVNNGNRIKLKYVFDHDDAEDGVVALIELTALPVLNIEQFAWLVPGMIREKITYLIKSLPKATRLQFNPLQDSITEFLEFANQDGNMFQQFVDYARQKKRIELNYVHIVDTKFIPQHVFHYRILDNKKVIASGDDLEIIRKELTPKLQKIVIKHSASQQINNVTDYIKEFATLLQEQKITAVNSKIIGYNSLIVEKDRSITFGVISDLTRAEQSTRRGLINLVKLHLKDQAKYLSTRKINNFAEISFALIDLYTKDELHQAIVDYILNNAIIDNLSPNYSLNEIEFNELVAKSRAKVGDITLYVVNVLINIAKYYTEVRRRLDEHSLADVIDVQLEELLYPQFLAYSKWQFLQQYPRYLQAILIRLDKYAKNQIRDSQFEHEINQLYDKWYNYVDSLEQRNKILMSEMHDFRYKIEELRISLFAQEIKTLYPVSLKRLLAELDSIYLKNLS